MNKVENLNIFEMDYPNLYELGIPIHCDPISHIKPNELKSKLTKKQQKLFSKYFGVATCPLVDGICCYYPFDCEKVLNKMATGQDFAWD